jgi:hypothetical protein
MSIRSHIGWSLAAGGLCGPLSAQTLITDFPWSTDLTLEQPFTLVNGEQANQWMWGDGTGNPSPCLYIGSDLTSGNAYWGGIDPWTAPLALSRVYAYVDLAIPEYHYAIDLYFDLRVGGDDDDRLEVLVMPADVWPIAGLNPSSLGPGVQAISSGLHGVPLWQTMHYVLSPEYAGRTIRLTFHWRNDWSDAVQPGAAIDNIRVETSPCITPFGLSVTNITTTTAVVEWPTMPTASAFHYELRTAGDPGSGSTGLHAADTVVSEQVLFQGLTPGTYYRLYLRTDCGNGLTAWSAGQTIVTDPACGSAFIDPAGPVENYGPLEHRTYVICPTEPAHSVRVEFSSLAISSGDRLEVFDGAVDTGAPKAIITGGAPTSIISEHNNGCLTFRFVSDAAWYGQGWQGMVTCEPRTGCTVWGTHLEQIDPDAALVEWHCTGGLPPFVVEHGALGWLPGNDVWAGEGGSLVFADTAAVVLTGLQPGMVYELEVRARCDAEEEYVHRSPVVRFQMDAACGYAFTDPGGEQESYPSYGNSVQTICPEDPDRPVSIAFTSFQLEPWYDVLYVFDGPDTLSPLIGSSNPAPLTTPNFGPGGWWGLSNLPETFVSSHPSGCLTTVFISDHTVEYEGWVAEVVCDFVGIPGWGKDGPSFGCAPNPARSGEELTLAFSPGLADIRLIEVLSICGQHLTVVPISWKENEHGVIRLPALSAGVYLLRPYGTLVSRIQARVVVY